jgi:hypothetical protein
LVGLMFKVQHSESPYGKIVTVSQMVYTKRTLDREFFIKPAIKNFKKFNREFSRRCSVKDELTVVHVLH